MFLRKYSQKVLLFFVVSCVFSTGLLAKPQKAQRDQLGNELTPVGAERVGNASGIIPPWFEGGIKAPSGWKTGDRYVDVFAGDEVRFVITAENHKDYLEHLTPGQVAMLKKYPNTFKMPIYASRRNATFPPEVYAATRKNAEKASLKGTDSMVDARLGIPFPIPSNGAEVIWNHKTKYRGDATVRFNVQLPVQTDGTFTPVVIEETIKYKYASVTSPPDKGDAQDMLILFLQEIKEPPRLAGQILLVHETGNQVARPRDAWLYNPGQRRVRRAPNVGYDNPGTGSDGLRTNDQFDMFNGALDRYDWKLLGKREIFIPYNSYKLNSDKLKYKDIAQVGHINPDHTRYEMHRVWVVDATRKQDTRHIYGRRTFYVDEDSWNITLVDVYDDRGALWRVQEGHLLNYWDLPATTSTAEFVYDIQNDRYLALGLDNEHDELRNPLTSGRKRNFKDGYFTPSNVRKLSGR